MQAQAQSQSQSQAQAQAQAQARAPPLHAQHRHRTMSPATSWSFAAYQPPQHMQWSQSHFPSGASLTQSALRPLSGLRGPAP